MTPLYLCTRRDGAQSHNHSALVSLALACFACGETTYDHESLTRPPPPPSRVPSAEDPPIVEGSAPKPQGLCDEPVRDRPSLDLPVWDLYVELENWDRLHERVSARVQVDAAVCIENVEHRIGLELQGASSRKADKRSFDLKFDRGKLFKDAPFGENTEPGGVDRTIIKAMAADQTLIREVVAFDFWRMMGHDAPHHDFVNLRINGKYWGLYVLVEPVDKDYLKRHGYPRNGTLYKAVRKHGSFADFAPGRDVEKAFENKTNEDNPTWDDIKTLVDALQNTPLEQEAYDEQIDPIFPLSQYFDRMAWVSLTQSGDATSQNFFLYNAPVDDKPFWHLIPWDGNTCLGSDWRDTDSAIGPEVGLMIDGKNHFGKRLVQVGGVRERYVSRFLSILDDVLTVEAMWSVIDRHAARVSRDLAVDRERWNRNIAPEDAIAVLYDFVERRPDILRDALDELVPGEDGREGVLGE